jgi:protein-S-isoprenylcysteine O-methyltransferase Ste14
MTETQAIGPAIPGNRLAGFTAFLFGGVAYLTFLFTILYAIGFVSGLVVPKAIDTGPESGIFEAIVVNLALMSLFAIQHSVMARKLFKHWWTRFIPRSVERSTYVLCASLTFLLLFWQWRPMPAVIWHVQEPEMAMVIATLSFIGWVIVFTSSFLIDHFEPFGLHQVASNLVGPEMPAPVFRTPFYYRFVRHPIYLGFIIAFWATPTMSAGHLLFATVTTAYIFIGIMLEERDLVGLFGDGYREHVSMLFPPTNLITSQLSVRRRRNYETYWKLFLRRGRSPGHRCAGRDGLLPLPLLPLVVRRTGERFHPMEAGSGTDHYGSATCCDVREDADEPAQVLCGVRWSSHDQSSDARAGRCLRRNPPDTSLHARRARQLRRDGAANAGRVA